MNANERIYSIGFLHPPIGNRTIILYKPPFIPKHSINSNLQYELNVETPNKMGKVWSNMWQVCTFTRQHHPTDGARVSVNVPAPKFPRGTFLPAISTQWCHTGSIQVNAV